MNREFVTSSRFGIALPQRGTSILFSASWQRMSSSWSGKEPMRGRDAFERSLRALLKQCRIESSGEIQEIEVSGSLAYSWANLKVRIIPLSGDPASAREGSTLSILRKESPGSWLIVRDANLLSARS